MIFQRRKIIKAIKGKAQLKVRINANLYFCGLVSRTHSNSKTIKINQTKQNALRRLRTMSMEVLLESYHIMAIF